MADQIPTVPGTGQPHLAIAQAFGFQLDMETVTSAMQATIDAARQVTDGLLGQINESMVNQVAHSAVFADGLKHQIASSLAAPVVAAQGALAELQQPIVSHLVNALGSTLEATMPLGVIPSQLAGENACPACVEIRSAAQSGDLTPAMTCFRETALPLHGVDGVRYSAALNFIQQCLPGDTVLQNTFLAWVQKVTTEPPTYPLSPAPGMGAPPAATASSTGAGILSTGPGFGPPPVSTRASVLPGGGLSPGSQLPGIIGGGGSQISLPTGGASGSGTGAGTSTGGTGTGTSGGGGYCDMLPALIQQFPSAMNTIGQTTAVPGATGPNGGQLFVTKVPNDPTGLPLYLFQEMGPFGPGGITVTRNVIECPLGNLPQPTPAPPPVPTPTPPGPTPTTPPPTCPAPPTCQPVQVTVKPCETPKPSDQTAPRTYCVWQNVETNVCYVDTQDNGPRSPNDQQLFCGKIDVGFVTQAIAACCQQQTQQQPGSSASTPFWPAPGVANGCDNLFRFQAFSQPLPANFFEQWIGSAVANLPPIFGTGNKTIDAVATGIRNGLSQISGTLIDTLINAASSAAVLNCSGTPNEGIILLTRIALGFIERWVSELPKSTTVPLEYAQNALCPFRIPTPAEAATAFLQNTVDADRLRCIVEANGNRWDSFWPLVYGARTRLNALQYGTLWMRDKISADDFINRMRQLGFLEPTDVDDVANLLKQIPPPTDLVRFMVRDAADEALVDRFNLDADFQQKFSGKLQDWARQQGVDETYMKYVWRSHWSIPAPGQLAEMLHRLTRYDREHPAYISIDDVRTAMEQQDIAPFWIEKFIAISYRPLTRIDARRAYEIGALGEDDLRNAYLDLGYNNDNAETLVEYNKKNVTRTFMRRGEIKQLAEGVISSADYDTAMQLFGATPEIMNLGRDYADLLRRVNSNKQCLKAYHKRFIQGDTTADTAIAQVQSLGQDLQSATQIVEGWKCEVVTRGKNFSFAQLNQLYEQGLIDESDYVRRAVRLGWDQDDAVLMLRLIQRRLNIKITNAQIAEARREQAAAEKLARQLRQAARQQAADVRREQTGIARMQRIRELREKRLLEAGEKFSVHSNMPLPDSIVYVRTVFKDAMAHYPVTFDEAIASLLVITSDKAVTTTAALEQALATALTNTANLPPLQEPTDAATLSTQLARPATPVR